MVSKQAMFHPKNTLKNLWKRPLNQNIKDRKSIFIECKCVLKTPTNREAIWPRVVRHDKFAAWKFSTSRIPREKIILTFLKKNTNTFWEFKNNLRNAVSKLPKLQVALYDNVLKRRVAPVWAFTARTPNRHQEPGWSRWKRSGGLGARLESPKRRRKLRWMNGLNLEHKSVYNIEIHGAKEVW